jgi:hypothetical protein
MTLLDCWVLGTTNAAKLWDAAEAARLLGIGCRLTLLGCCDARVLHKTIRLLGIGCY